MIGCHHFLLLRVDLKGSSLYRVAVEKSIPRPDAKPLTTSDQVVDSPRAVKVHLVEDLESKSKCPLQISARTLD